MSSGTTFNTGRADTSQFDSQLPVNGETGTGSLTAGLQDIADQVASQDANTLLKAAQNSTQPQQGAQVVTGQSDHSTSDSDVLNQLAKISDENGQQEPLSVVAKTARLLEPVATEVGKTLPKESSDTDVVQTTLDALNLEASLPDQDIPTATLDRELLGSLSDNAISSIQKNPALENELGVDKKFNDKRLVSFQSDLALAAIQHVSGNTESAQQVQQLVREVTREIVADIESNGITETADKKLGFLKNQLPATLQELANQPLGEDFDLSLHLYFQAEVGFQSDAVAPEHEEAYSAVEQQQNSTRKHVGKYYGDSEGIKRTPQTQTLGIGLDENAYDTIFEDLRTEDTSHFSGGRIWHVAKPTDGEANVSGPSGTAYRTLATAQQHLGELTNNSNAIDVYKSLVIANLVNQGHHSIEEAVKTTQTFGEPIQTNAEGRVDFSDVLDPVFTEGNELFNQVQTAYPDFL